MAWLRSEGLIPSGEDDEVHPRVASQKCLGTLSQHEEASRADLQHVRHSGFTRGLPPLYGALFLSAATPFLRAAE